MKAEKMDRFQNQKNEEKEAEMKQEINIDSDNRMVIQLETSDVDELNESAEEDGNDGDEA